MDALARQDESGAWPPYGLDQLGVCSVRAACKHPVELARRVRAAAVSNGSCRAVGLLGCGDGHALGDAWDPLLIWLGRLLDYESILLRSTLCGCGWLCGPCVSQACPPVLSVLHSELLDLRVPDAVRWRADGLNRTLFVAGSPEWRSGRARAGHAGSVPPLSTARKEPKLAAVWMAAYRDSQVLTLRDPLRVWDDARARPCTFTTPRASLGCAGHPSDQLATIEDSEIWGFRSVRSRQVPPSSGGVRTPSGSADSPWILPEPART